MFFKKKSESGRSMVEMLGVLAIIGVLSIGGIAGYTLSMRRYRANQVLDAVNKYALVVYGACQKALMNGEIPSITECGSALPPSFKDAGLGAVADAILIDPSWITQESGVDTVHIYTIFRDKQVCKSAKSILGLKSDAGANCETYIRIPIKMN